MFRYQLLLSFLVSTLLTVSIACKKPSDQLTAPTQTGANTFSCKVNGTVYIARYQYAITDTMATGIAASNFPGTGVFQLNTVNELPGKPTLRIVIVIPYLQSTGTYPLGAGKYNATYMPAHDYQYFTDDTHTGSVTIVKLDPVNHICSGTFSFTAYAAASNIAYSVTDGRFDVKYQ